MTNINSVTPLDGAKPKTEKHFKESAIAITAGIATSVAISPLGKLAMNKVSKIYDLPQDQIDLMKSKLDEAITKTGLDKKGVTLNYIPTEKAGGFSLKDLIIQNPLKQLKEGKNAFFNPLDNKIYLPENKLTGTGFHEIGHAMNKNFSKVGKILQKVRPIGLILAGIPMILGAFSTTKKAEEGKELSTGNKVTNFIRNNAGKLSFAALLPILAEEAMATIKGEKLAKELLKPDLAKTVLKGNRLAYLSYVVTAVGGAMSAWAAVKIKDKLVAKKA